MSSNHDPLIGQPIMVKMSYQAVRFLAWSNGLEVFLAVLGLAYALGFWVFKDIPALATMYPLARNVSVVMIGTGVMGIVGVNMGWRPLRMASSICAFMAWSLLSVGSFGGGTDMHQRSFLMLGTIAVAELLVFVRLHLRMEDMRDTIEAAKLANNLHFKRYGTPLPPHQTDTTEGQGNVGNDSGRD